MTAVAHALAAVVANEHLVLCGSAAGSTAVETTLTQAGARRVDHLRFEPTSAEGIWRQMQAYEHTLASPPPSLVAAIDQLDPAHRALVYAGSFTAHEQLSGRKIIGARQQAWLRAEDRRTQAQLTGRPSRIVALPELTQVVRKAPDGAVVRGIPRDFVSLGSTHNVLVAHDAPLDPLVSLLETDCDEASVSPYIAGLPLTVYGFVFGQRVVVAPPVLAIVFASRGDGRIHAPGIVTAPPLPPDIRGTAIGAAEKIALRLSNCLGYRGAFGLDGSFHAGRLVVHDVNPRVCAGFRVLPPEILGGSNPSSIDLALREAPLATEIIESLPPVLPAIEPRVVLWNDGHDEALACLDPPNDLQALISALHDVALQRGDQLLGEPVV